MSVASTKAEVIDQILLELSGVSHSSSDEAVRRVQNIESLVQNSITLDGSDLLHYLEDMIEDFSYYVCDPKERAEFVGYFDKHELDVRVNRYIAELRGLVDVADR